MIILTTIKFYTILYAYIRLEDKYCDKEMRNYKHKKFWTGHGIVAHFPIWPMGGI
jgi:hypothetical protein